MPSGSASPGPPGLLHDALAIWQAGLAAVRSEALLSEIVHRAGNELWIGDHTLPLDEIRRIVVVGAGKAGAGMAAGLLQALGSDLLREKHVTGWVNVPADCVRPLEAIHLHPARPAGVNEPTPEGVTGTAEILRIVAGLGPRDVCFALISGGASALTPAPVDGISLADKLAVTRHLSAAGANITQLNTVRKALSRFKGGGLAQSCRAGRLFTLILSDVLGDPLDVIGSGPTIHSRTTLAEALAVLEELVPSPEQIPRTVWDHLRSRPTVPQGALPAAIFPCQVENLVIGNNALAVDAAGLAAEKLGYTFALDAARAPEGAAEDVGRHLATLALSMRRGQGPAGLISGGEPVVRLRPESERGRGGRNQQLVLAAMAHLLAAGDDGHDLVLLSAGTDGEDGPTDAAGAWLDSRVLAACGAQGLDAAAFLQRNDAYTFFEQTGSLLKTGPTHTNVCDLRVLLTRQRSQP